MGCGKCLEGSLRRVAVDELLGADVVVPIGLVPWSVVNRRKRMTPGDGPVSLFICIHICIYWSGGTGAAFLSFFIDIPNEEIYFGANEPRIGSISLRLLNSLRTNHRPYQWS